MCIQISLNDYIKFCTFVLLASNAAINKMMLSSSLEIKIVRIKNIKIHTCIFKYTKVNVRRNAANPGGRNKPISDKITYEHNGCLATKKRCALCSFFLL